MSQRLVKTKREKEFQSLPECRYDPLHNWKCHRPREESLKAAREACKNCLLRNIADSLEEHSPSETMRSVIALVSFYEESVR